MVTVNPATVYLNNTNNANSTEPYYIKNSVEHTYAFSLTEGETYMSLALSLSLTDTHTHTYQNMYHNCAATFSVLDGFALWHAQGTVHDIQGDSGGKVNI